VTASPPSPSLSVALVAGGASSEAGVSRASAAGVLAALEEAGHQPTLLELDAGLAAKLRGGKYDVVFPAVHGRFGEDGCLQGLLEILGLPYVGSGVLASALAMSKPHAKAQFRTVSLPLAEEALVSAGSDLAEAARSIRKKLGAAVVVKPGAGGSAIGVEPVGADASDAELAAAIGRALSYDPVVLVEKMIAGKETTCAVLEDETGVPRALPPTLITPKAAGWYDFRSKYAPSGSAHQCPAPYSPALIARISDFAVKAHVVLGCRDLSRVDFVVDDERDEITLLEVNTLPGMTAVSLFPEAAAVAGIPFPALCDRLVRRAFARPRRAAVEGLPMPV
jgi:D-alanine-D-alanine ligase